jgi:hypothetical protein
MSSERIERIVRPWEKVYVNKEQLFGCEPRPGAIFFLHLYSKRMSRFTLKTSRKTVAGWAGFWRPGPSVAVA